MAGAACALALGLAIPGCAQPGTQVSKADAARLDAATTHISTACGFREELTAYGPGAPAQLSGLERSALTGARKLAAVYARDPSGIYQGESVGAIVNDSISLLAGCGLEQARRLLQHVLEKSG